MSFNIPTTTFFAILALLLMTASSQNICAVDGNGDTCFASGECISYSNGDEFCACASGDSGLYCSTAVEESCDFNTVDDLITSNIPQAVTASFTNDELTVVVKSPLVTERGYTRVYVDDAVRDDQRCGYPGDYWSRSFDGCLDEYTGVMPWSISQANCGWVFDDTDPDYFIFNADMIVEHHDFIDPFAGRAGSEPVERLTEHLIPLEVQFQKFVDVQTDITVNAEVALLAAITRQTVDATTKEAVIEVATNLLHPYKLDNEAISLFPEEYDYPYTIEEISDPADCPNTEGTSCTQLFRITMDASSGCEITGLYDILYDLDCQLDSEGAAYPSCAVESDASASLQLDVTSEDFCAKVTVRVEIDGTLSSFFDSAYSVPQSQFLVEQVTYYQADLSSPDATLTSALIDSVKIVDETTETILYASGSSLVPGASFSLDTSGSDFATFYFTASQSFLSGITEETPKPLTVVARVDVTFEGVPGVKRVTLQGPLNDKTMSLLGEIGVRGSADDDLELEGSSSRPAFVSVMALFAAVVALLF